MNNQQVECGCDEIPQSLLSTDEALDILLDSAKVTSKTSYLELDDALNGILAIDLCSSINVPDFDNSAMDGYAINLETDKVNIPGGLTFDITDRIAAGSIGNNLSSGCAARIFTGAPIPKGANTVVMQEECSLTDNDSKIEIYRPISLKENIRPKGNDIEIGDLILRSGIKLMPQDIANNASVGTHKL